MNNQRPEMFVPALIGGVVAGVLSGIPLLNCLCCLWIIGGAMLSSYLLAKNSPVALSAGDGAIVGAFSGIIAAVVHTLISIPFARMTSDLLQKALEYLPEYTEEMPPGLDNLMRGGGEGTNIPLFFLGLVITAIVFALLGVLGGIIGISLFGKKFVPDKPEGGGDVPKDSSYR
jgi:hypothetical protein